MIECDMDRIADYTPPPTREQIEQVRREQIEALKAFRRKVLQFRSIDTSAA